MTESRKRIPVFLAILTLAGASSRFVLDSAESTSNRTNLMILTPIGFRKPLFVGEASWGRKGVPSWEAIDDGHRLRESGNEIGAISHWKALAFKCKEVDIVAACAALENVARCHLDRGDLSAAIATYKEIVAIGERGGVNTAYYACTQLSDLYVQCGHVPQSLEFALLAKTKFRFSSFCGDSWFSQNVSLDRRVEELQTAASIRSAVALRTQITMQCTGVGEQPVSHGQSLAPTR